jgi:GAF domain-containing protein
MKLIQDTQSDDNERVISLHDVKAVRNFGNKALQCATLQDVSKLLFDLVEENIKAQVTSLFLFLKNGEIERVSIRGKDNRGEPIDPSWLDKNGRHEHYLPGMSFSGKVLEPEEGFAYGKPILSNDIKNDYRLEYGNEYEQKLGSLRNGISVPLNGTHRTFGTIEAINKIDGDFTQRDLGWLTIVGGHVSTAISRLRKNKEEEVIRYLENTLRSKNGAKSIDEISGRVADLLVKDDLMSYKFCTFRFIDREGTGLLARATSSYSDELSVENKIHLNRRVNQGLVGKVYRTKEPIEIKKIKENIKLFVNREWIIGSKLQSFFCFPLIYQGRAIGTMSVFTGYEYELHDRDRDFLQLVSFLVASCYSVIEDIDRDKDLIKKAFDIQLSIENDLTSSDLSTVDTNEIEKSTQEIKAIINKKKSPPQSFYNFPHKAESLLLHEFKIRMRNSPQDSIVLPMLLKVKDPDWQAQGIPDYDEFYRSEGGSVSIIACTGSYRTVKALNEELDVISISADHVMSSDDRDVEIGEECKQTNKK